MDGDNNLERWVSHDINEELAAVGSNADVQVVVLADRGPRLQHRGRRLDGHTRVQRHQGHARDAGERRRGLGRAGHGLAPDAHRLRHLGARELPVPAHGPLLLGPRLGLVARLHDARRDQQRHAGHGRDQAIDGGRVRGGHGRHGHLPRPDDRGAGHLPGLRQGAGRERGLHRVHGRRLRAGARQAAGRPRHGGRRAGEDHGGLVPHRARPLDPGELGGRAGLALGPARAPGGPARVEAPRGDEEAPARLRRGVPAGRHRAVRRPDERGPLRRRRAAPPQRRLADPPAHLRGRHEGGRPGRAVRVEHTGRGASARHRHLLARRARAARPRARARSPGGTSPTTARSSSSRGSRPGRTSSSTGAAERPVGPWPARAPSGMLAAQ